MKLGIHGTNVAVDHEESDTSKKSSPKLLLQFVRIRNICHAVTGEAGTILRVMTSRLAPACQGGVLGRTLKRDSLGNMSAS